MLVEYFTNGTEKTKTARSIGMEVETDFLLEDGSPLPIEATQQILSTTKQRPPFCQQKLELGRQKVELSIDPQSTSALAIEAMTEALTWLYRQARELGAFPQFTPEVDWCGELLWVQEERDEIWVNLDGKAALEELCRCSSVQFTIDVHPAEAITMINRLHQARIPEYGYAPNHQRWLNYLHLSRANYRPDRYGGPTQFADLAEYVSRLEEHDVVMHNGQPIRQSVGQVSGLNVDLFLRSIWWHYRLRRYGNTLAIEIRPFARRKDETFAHYWKLVAQAIGF